MFFCAGRIVESIKKLENVHPFLGITFLACKKANLPVGKSVNFPLDSVTNKFLQEFHRISPDTEWFFQPFKSSDRKKKWVRPDYAAKGLQAINTQTFRDVFLHERNTSIWGWKDNYIDVLLQKFSDSKQKVPAIDMAIWIYRNIDFVSLTMNAIIERFFSEFNITPAEQSLFIIDESASIKETDFQDNVPTWAEFRVNELPDPPDSAPEQGGTLTKLSINSVGPLNNLYMEPAKRLSLITGDNGLGKTFILDAAWWALTGLWVDSPAYPNETSDFIEPEIRFAITGTSGIPTADQVAHFDPEMNMWIESQKRQAITGLSIYARVDGSFAFWDPIKYKGQNIKCNISSDEVWRGDVRLLGGLISDWNLWQNSPSSYEFKMFCEILKKLSPPDLGPLVPGDSVRIPGYNTKVPTISHAYGKTPIVYASAGVRRIMALAYLVVWVWTEHLAVAASKYETPQQNMVVLIDEMEAHLHPKWQRQFLPALIEIPNILQAESSLPPKHDLKVQFLIATHSPLVMASSEVVFDMSKDKLFHLELDNGLVLLDECQFINQGDVSAWLESSIFELKHARSVDAELALEAAKNLQSNPTASKEEVISVNEQLKRHLAGDDRFWPRWVGFAAKFGVDA